jgi:sulfide dehydrogenase cytochrome subunit
MPRSLKTVGVLAAGMFLSAVGTAGAHAAKVSPGAMLANSCAGCHGTGGQSPGAIPSIAGKSADFIADALKGFQSGSREATVMGRHAKGYSEEEIKLIAEFFASQ